MTLLPSSDFGIRGHEGKPYDVNDVCAHPYCGRTSAHVHHLWPRSFLRKQPVEWVSLLDGTVLGNRVGLCFDHHEQVTGRLGGYAARILYTFGVFVWDDRRDDGLWQRVGPLSYQPPGSRKHEHKQERKQAEVCPTCGEPKKPPRPKRARRSTKTWTLDVPADEEIGAAILDEWADEFAAMAGFGDASSRLRRYHAVTLVFAWAMQNKEQFADDIVEAANA